MAVLDFAWTRYTLSLGRGTPARSATWAMLLFMLGACVTRGYTLHEWTILPAALGAWVGTYLGDRRKP